MMDNELILFDRLEVIKQTISKYGEENFYLSFSGGKDSTVVHHLLDMALPDNKIPRVFSNTGIEYTSIVKFVKELAKSDERFVIIQNKKSIKKTLEEYGYPFKSKEYSNWQKVFMKHKDRIIPYIKEVESNPKLLEDWEYIHNLPVNVKYVVCQYFGVREREREVHTFTAVVPKKLQYQFTKEFDLNISDQCCVHFKEKPLKDWQKENKKPYTILGLMREEGGRRAYANCVVFQGNKLKSFHPLAKVSREWEEWFIKKYDIKLCELYYPPYNFERTGCKGCPYNIHIQRELTTLEKLLPHERRQCEIIWQPIYEEYRRIGYRLKKEEQIKLF